MYGTSSRKGARCFYVYENLTSSDVDPTTLANKNSSAREWLVISSYLYIIIAFLRGRDGVIGRWWRGNWEWDGIEAMAR